MIEVFVLYQNGIPTRWHEVPYYSDCLETRKKITVKAREEGLSGQLIKKQIKTYLFNEMTRKLERI
jgi:hypothetical protein